MAYAPRHPYRWAAVLGFVTGVAEIFAGLAGFNPALTADGLHALVDGLANAVSAIVAERGNGWRSRGARVNGAFLFFGSLWIASEAIEAIVEGGAIPTRFSIVVAGVGLAVNMAQYALVAADSHRDALRGSTLDHIGGDLRGSLVVVAVGLAAHGAQVLRLPVAPFLVPVAALFLAAWLAKKGIRWASASCDHHH